MATPVKNQHGVFYLREKVPADIRERVKGREVTLPVGDERKTVRIGETVKLSLGTKETPVARQRFAEAHAALVRFYDNVRRGEVTLDFKQAMALAKGDFTVVADAVEAYPGPPEMWAHWLRVNASARETPEKMERWFGPSVDNILAERGLTLADQSSRDALLKAVAIADELTAQRGTRRAQGDYSDDGLEGRFPEWTPPAPDNMPLNGSKKPAEAPQAKKAGLSIAGLFERWKAFADGKKAPATIDRYSASFKSLSSFTKKPAADVTGDDLFSWFQHRVTKENVTARSVNRNDRVAVSSIYKWAASREGGRIVPCNPVKGLEVLTEDKKTRTRDRMFTEEEAKRILGAAMAVEVKDARTRAQRWTPWLAAYSGARIGELCALTVDDIRQEGPGIWTMSFKATKTDVPRIVPLHEHIVAMGFLAAIPKTGPIFYDPKRHKKGVKTTPVNIASRKMAAWVREVCPELPLEIDPNHAWRHTWKSRALAAGVEARMRDIIAGHGPDSVARSYEHADTKAKAKAVNAVPRYCGS